MPHQHLSHAYHIHPAYHERAAFQQAQHAYRHHHAYYQQNPNHHYHHHHHPFIARHGGLSSRHQYVSYHHSRMQHSSYEHPYYVDVCKSFTHETHGYRPPPPPPDCQPEDEGFRASVSIKSEKEEKPSCEENVLQEGYTNKFGHLESSTDERLFNIKKECLQEGEGLDVETTLNIDANLAIQTNIKCVLEEEEDEEGKDELRHKEVIRRSICEVQDEILPSRFRSADCRYSLNPSHKESQNITQVRENHDKVADGTRGDRSTRENNNRVNLP